MPIAYMHEAFNVKEGQKLYLPRVRAELGTIKLALIREILDVVPWTLGSWVDEARNEWTVRVQAPATTDEGYGHVTMGVMYADLCMHSFPIIVCRAECISM